MTLSQLGLGRSVGLILKRRGEDDLNGSGSLARGKSDNGRVPSLSVPLSALAKMLAVECGKMVTLPPISR